MLYYLLYHTLQRYFSPLNVFRYITVRTVYASLTAMFLALAFGPSLIRRLRELQIGQFIREEGPQEHKKKAGTPTMGGVLIVLSTAVPTLLWADLTNPFILLSLFALVGFAVIGFIDDYAKVSKQRNLGLTAKKKIYFQVFVSLIVGVVLLVLATNSAYSTQFRSEEHTSELQSHLNLVCRLLLEKKKKKKKHRTKKKKKKKKKKNKKTKHTK